MSYEPSFDPRAAGIGRRDFFKRAGTAGLALTLPALLEACGSGGGASLNSITWGAAAGLDNLNFLNALNMSAEIAQTMFLEGLVTFDNQGNVVPQLASSFQNHGFQTLVFQIRPGVKWHDGKPFSVDDAVYQYQFHLQPQITTGIGGYWQGTVASVQQTGPSEVTITLLKPKPLFLSYLAADAGYIMRRDQLENGAYKGMGTPSSLPLGTGPYRVTQFTTSSSAVFDRFDGYWGRKPVVKRVSLQIIKEDNLRLLAMRSGQIDGTYDVPVQNLKQWQRLSGVRTDAVISLDQWFIGMNVTRAPFDDIHVRRAMAHALDRAAIISAVWGGNALPTTTLVPPQEWNGLLTSAEVQAFYATLPQYPYDLKAAASELAESKYPHGFPITILTTDQRPQQALTCEVFAQSLKKIGITLNIRQVADSQWFNEILNNNSRTMGMTINDYGIGAIDPAYNLALVDPTRAIPNSDNVAHYINESLFQPFDIARSGAPATVRAMAFKEITMAAARDLPYLSLVDPLSAVAVKSSLRYNGYSPFHYLHPLGAALSPS